jgi:ribosomal-protein-alanine N-acetyltransferase
MTIEQEERLPNAYAVGQRIWLRAPTRADAEGPWHEWLSDEEVGRYLGQWMPNTPERQVAFYEQRVESSGDIILAIIDREDNRHIGITSLSKIDWIHRYAEVALLIGDKKARDEAVFGFEAFALTIRIAFQRLNLDNIKGGYIEGQSRSEAFLKALRFREAGRMKELYKIDGRPCDQVLVQLSRADWAKRNGLASNSGSSPETK